MFGFKKKNNEFKIVSTQSGQSVDLSNVPDEAFSQNMLGVGVAIIPNDNKIVSPVDGTIIQIADTLHAYGIQTDEGIDILVHIGINTVELKGEGFFSYVKEGDKVKAGDHIADVDINFLKEKNYEIYSPVIITNISEIKDFKFHTGLVTAGKDCIITYTK